jgi:hypothetical protein
MSERLRTHGANQTERAPSPEDIRRRLEGRAEIIEAARKRYADLERGLERGSWRGWLKSQRKLVSELLGQEPELAEALSRARRRAEAEGWPENTPVLVAMREVTVLRARLETRVRRRLEELSTPIGEPSLTADLPRLDEIVRAAAPVTLEQGETIVTRMQGPKWLQVSPLLFVLAPIILNLMGMTIGPKAVAIGVSLLLACLALIITVGMRVGSLWLTNERLLWKSMMGEHVAVRLRSIPDGGVRLNRILGTVHVAGDRKVRARHVTEPDYLLTLLELHRQPPLLGAVREEGREPDLVYYPASLRLNGTWHRGLAVLRPDNVSFIPEGRGREALKAVTGKELDQRVELEWVLDELRWLPEPQLDEWLARVATATGGVHWSSTDARYVGDVPVWKEICIKRWPDELIGRVNWKGQGVAERVLASWPLDSAPSEPSRRG